MDCTATLQLLQANMQEQKRLTQAFNEGVSAETIDPLLQHLQLTALHLQRKLIYMDMDRVLLRMKTAVQNLFSVVQEDEAEPEDDGMKFDEWRDMEDARAEERGEL